MSEETITFRNETYNVSDLSQDAIQSFNVLLKLQAESDEQSFQLSKTRVAQETMSDRFSQLLLDEKISPVKKTEDKKIEIVKETETKTIEQ